MVTMESGPRPLDAKVSHVLSFVYEPRGPFLEIRREGLRVGEGLLDRGWWIHYKSCGDTPIAILLSFFFTFIHCLALFASALQIRTEGMGVSEGSGDSFNYS